jgi:hypothetical protein
VLEMPVLIFGFADYILPEISFDFFDSNFGFGNLAAIGFISIPISFFCNSDNLSISSAFGLVEYFCITFFLFSSKGNVI